MKSSEIVRKAIQTAYCMEYDIYCAVMLQDPNYYSKEKWQLQQKNFTRWYCELDSQHASRFMDYVLRER